MAIANRTTRALNRSPLQKGSQEFAAHMMGGCLLQDGVEVYNDIFAHSVSDPYPGTGGSNYVQCITNLENPGKMGDSESFLAYQYGISFMKLTAGSETAANIQLLTKFIQSARFELFIGSNKTRVLDIQLSHFMGTINLASADATSTVLPINSARWITLAGVPQQFKRNMNFYGRLTCGFPAGTPSGLGTEASPIYAFQFIAAGKRTTK